MKKILYYKLNFKQQTDRLKSFCNKYIKWDAQKQNVREARVTKEKDDLGKKQWLKLWYLSYNIFKSWLYVHNYST